MDPNGRLVLLLRPLVDSDLVLFVDASDLLWPADASEDELDSAGPEDREALSAVADASDLVLCAVEDASDSTSA